MPKGVDSIGGTRASELTSLDAEPRHSCDCQREHGSTLLGRGAVLADLEGLFAGRDESKGIEPQLLGDHLCDDEVAVMHGIE